MTPLITEMLQLSLSPEKSTWFDLGQMSRPDNARVQSDADMRLPFDRTSIVCVDEGGVKFVLWFVGGDEGFAVGGVSKHAATQGAFGKYFEPVSYIQTPRGIRYDKGDSQIDDADMEKVFRLACACLLKLHSCTEAHQPTVKSNSLTNKRRIAKGKPPLIYDWHTVKLEPSEPVAGPQGGSHATPRRHQCRGHWRNCLSGKRVWVKECWKGDASRGTIFKDYKAAQND